MNYIDKYDISAKRIIERMIPYFLKGRRFLGVLISSFIPIKSLHNDFKQYASDTLFKARLPFQVLAIEWRINKLMKEEFGWKGDGCKINKYAHQKYLAYVYGFSDEKSTFYVDSFDADKQDINNIIKSRKTVSADTSKSFNIEIPQFGTVNMQERLQLRIREIIREYTIITQYDILIIE